MDLFDPEPVEKSVVGTPVTADAHLQCKVHMTAKLPFYGASRSHTDGLDHTTTRADQDPLLGLGLGQDHGLDPDQKGEILWRMQIGRGTELGGDGVDELAIDRRGI